MSRLHRLWNLCLIAALAVTATGVAAELSVVANADESVHSKKAAGSARRANEKPAFVASLSAQLRYAAVKENDSIELDFVLWNHSDRNIVLAERWNSWGACQWSFEVVDATGAKFMLRNPQMNWYANAFTTFTIHPSQSHVTKCRLDLTSWKFQDGPIAVFSPVRTSIRAVEQRRNTWEFPLSITGSFSAPKDNLDVGETASANWSGTITTKALRIGKAERAAVLQQTRSPQEHGRPETPSKVHADVDKKAAPAGEFSTPSLTPDEEEWIFLAPLVRKERDLRDAGWEWDGQTARFSAGKPRAAVSIPINLAGSYELQTRVKIERAKEVTALHLPINGNRAVVLEMRGDRGNSESPTALRRSNPEFGRNETSRCELGPSIPWPAPFWWRGTRRPWRSVATIRSCVSGLATSPKSPKQRLSAQGRCNWRRPTTPYPASPTCDSGCYRDRLCCCLRSRESGVSVGGRSTILHKNESGAFKWSFVVSNS